MHNINKTDSLLVMEMLCHAMEIFTGKMQTVLDWIQPELLH